MLTNRHRTHAFPRGDRPSKARISGPDEECGQKSYDFCDASGLLKIAAARHSCDSLRAALRAVARMQSAAALVTRPFGASSPRERGLVNISSKETAEEMEKGAYARLFSCVKLPFCLLWRQNHSSPSRNRSIMVAVRLARFSGSGRSLRSTHWANCSSSSSMWISSLPSKSQ